MTQPDTNIRRRKEKETFPKCKTCGKYEPGLDFFPDFPCSKCSSKEWNRGNKMWAEEGL